jgi:uncharacterized protein YkvS
MMTNTNAAIGSVCITHRGNSGIVERLEHERVIIRIPDGRLKSIPLTAIARWELPAPFSVGCIVHKRFNDGWTGIVMAIISPDRVEVLWWLDKHPSLMSVDDLKPADESTTKGYQKAFKKEIK